MKSRPEWTDRRIWNHATLLFTAGVVTYAVVWHPLAPAASLIASTVEALITASVFVVTGYTIGRLAGKHRALKGEIDHAEPK